MKEPYVTGQIYQYISSPANKVMILGHIWWNIEKVHAYYLVRVNDEGEPTKDPEYCWCDGGLEPVACQT